MTRTAPGGCRARCAAAAARAFCFVFMNEQTSMPPATPRDPPARPRPPRPRLGRGLRDAALDIVGASFIREIEPGELLAIDADGLRSKRFAPKDPRAASSGVRLSRRVRTTINGQVVHESRVEMGRTLAREHPSTPTWSCRRRSRGRRPRSATRRNQASLMARAWSRMPMSGGPSSRPHQTIRQLGIR